VVDFFVDEPVLLLFLVVGLGAGLGAVRIKGVAIGPAAALFVGLGFGALDDRLSDLGALSIFRELGLVLFTYTVGLASGPTFFAAIRRGAGWTLAGVVGLVAVLGGITAATAAAFGFTPAERAGLFAGSTTNTPALQAAAESVTEGDPVVAYSLAYPVAVAAMLVVLTLFLDRRLTLPASIDPPPPPPRVERLVNWTVTVSTPGLPTLGELRERHPGIGFSRIGHGDMVSVAESGHLPEPGDRVVVLGPPEAVAAFCLAVGERSDEHLPLDRAALDFRRILVSNRRLAGRHLAEIDLEGRFGVSVTRLRRGDDDLVATPDLALQLGDRVRVVGTADALTRVA
jgi:putative transport protein